jgi:hypothetical protein
MAMQLSQLDLQNPAILKEQLIGVDAAYFSQVLRLLNDKDPEKIDFAYLTQLIEKMF